MSPNTNSIGAGRFNVAVPLWEEEAAVLHRTAGQDKSRVELIRELILAGARVMYPHVATQIEAIRSSKAAIKSATVKSVLSAFVAALFTQFIACVLVVGLVLQFIAGQCDPARRVSRRSRRDEIGQVEFLETEEA